jgi:hypothetical protein
LELILETQDNFTTFEEKHLKFLDEFNNEAGINAISAFKTGNLTIMEKMIEGLTFSVSTGHCLLGAGLVIIDRTKSYKSAGYKSFMQYAGHLYKKLHISPVVLNEAKAIMEVFFDFCNDLREAGFSLMGNAQKLLYFKEACNRHGKEETLLFITKSSNAMFKKWATSDVEITEEEMALSVHSGPILLEFDGEYIIINGLKITRFSSGHPMMTEKLMADLILSCKIREEGGEPHIVNVKNSNEKKANDSVLDKLRKEKGAA